MARFHFIGRTRDSYGNVVPDIGISIYLAETTTPATIFTQKSGGSPISVAPQITSDNTGGFHFYIDDSIHPYPQLFDIVCADITYTNIDIIRQGHEGYSGYSSYSGYSGKSGSSGYSGHTGLSGISGYSGLGLSGYSGQKGINGIIGSSGYSGESGYSAYSGYSGERGASGVGTGSYLHEQTEAEMIWFVNHNLSQSYVDVIVYNETNYEEIPSSIDIIDEQNLVITFSHAVAGHALVTANLGKNGTSGYSGYSGLAGDIAYSGVSGISGYSGQDGVIGHDGVSGFSGYSGPSPSPSAEYDFIVAEGELPPVWERKSLEEVRELLGGGGSTYKKVIDICPDDYEIEGQRYQTISGAFDYIGSLPSLEGQRYAVRVYGWNYENIDFSMLGSNLPYTELLGVNDNWSIYNYFLGEQTILFGTVTISGDCYCFIKNCAITKIITGDEPYVFLDGCFISDFDSSEWIGNGGIITIFNTTIVGGKFPIEEGLYNKHIYFYNCYIYFTNFYGGNFIECNNLDGNTYYSGNYEFTECILKSNITLDNDSNSNITFIRSNVDGTITVGTTCEVTIQSSFVDNIVNNGVVNKASSFIGDYSGDGEFNDFDAHNALNGLQGGKDFGGEPIPSGEYYHIAAPIDYNDFSAARFYPFRWETISQAKTKEILVDSVLRGKWVLAELISHYPPEQNNIYVTSNLIEDGGSPYWHGYNATNPLKSLIGDAAGNSFRLYQGYGRPDFARLDIDLGKEKVITKFYFENFHSSGGSVGNGPTAFKIFGTNYQHLFDSGNENLNLYSEEEMLEFGWTNLTPPSATLDLHIESDESDPQYKDINNFSPYRYYSICFYDSLNPDEMAIRRIELQGYEYYFITDVVYNDLGIYKCKVDHIPTAEDEPGYGINWQDYWILIVDLTEINHNKLSNLQGGSPETSAGAEDEEYYHLTESLYDNLKDNTPKFESVTIKGTTGGYCRMYSEETASIETSGATIPVAIPVDSVIIGCQLRVEEELATGELWDATYVGGSTLAICIDEPVAVNTKVNSFVSDMTEDITNINITKSGGGSFTVQGKIRAIVYYEKFDSMSDV